MCQVDTVTLQGRETALEEVVGQDTAAARVSPLGGSNLAGIGTFSLSSARPLTNFSFSIT